MLSLIPTAELHHDSKRYYQIKHVLIDLYCAKGVLHCQRKRAITDFLADLEDLAHLSLLLIWYREVKYVQLL